jgi:shikimate kinase
MCKFFELVVGILTFLIKPNTIKKEGLFMEWLCKNCGTINNYGVELFGFDKTKIKNDIGIRHIYPICNNCKSSVKILYRNNIFCDAIILNGTCGSGKTSISKCFYTEQEQFIIDGDRVIEIAREKHKEKYEYNSNEVYNEIIEEIIIGKALNKKIILNHIFSKDEFIKFSVKLFENKIRPIMVILRPTVEIAYSRTQERTSFRNKTERKWVEYFDQMMMDYDPNEFIIIDNSNYTIEETIKNIKEKIMI